MKVSAVQVDNLTPAEPPGIPVVLIFSGEQSYQPRLYTEIGSLRVGLHKHRLPQLG